MLVSFAEAVAQMEVTYRNTISIFLSNALSFGLALLEGMLVLELGSHIDGYVMTGGE